MKKNIVIKVIILILFLVVTIVTIFKFTILKNPFQGEITQVVYVSPQEIYYKTTDTKQLASIQNLLQNLKTVERKGKEPDMTGSLPVVIMISSQKLSLAVYPNEIYVNGICYLTNKDITSDLISMLTEKAEIVSSEDSGFADSTE